MLYWKQEYLSLLLVEIGVGNWNKLPHMMQLVCWKTRDKVRSEDYKTI